MEKQWHERSCLSLYPGCELSDEQREFAVAMDRRLTAKGRKGKPVDARDVLEVARQLGYRRTSCTSDSATAPAR